MFTSSPSKISSMAVLTWTRFCVDTRNFVDWSPPVTNRIAYCSWQCASEYFRKSSRIGYSDTRARTLINGVTVFEYQIVIQLSLTSLYPIMRFLSTAFRSESPAYCQSEKRWCTLLKYLCRWVFHVSHVRLQNRYCIQLNDPLLVQRNTGNVLTQYSPARYFCDEYFSPPPPPPAKRQLTHVSIITRSCLHALFLKFIRSKMTSTMELSLREIKIVCALNVARDQYRPSITTHH